VKYRRPALGLVVATILLAGIWPRERALENRVSWLESGSGLLLEAPSQAIGEMPVWIDTGALTLELWLESEAPEQTGNYEIVSLLDGPGIHRLLVGQFGDGLILRGRLDNPTGDPKLDHYVDAWHHSDLRHLAVTIGSGGARLFANGRPTGLALAATRAEAGVPFGGRLLLGTSDDHWSTWQGSVFAVAIHARILDQRELALHADLRIDPDADRPGSVAASGLSDLMASEQLVALYLFEEGAGRRSESRIAGAPALLLPERLTRPKRTTLLTGLPHQRWLPMDTALNILAFVPLGFLIASGRNRRGLGWALLGGVVLSLAIEVAQLWIPNRDSSLIDLISNTGGALLGGLLAVLLPRTRALLAAVQSH
jgi:hypothetical protein